MWPGFSLESISCFPIITYVGRYSDPLSLCVSSVGAQKKHKQAHEGSQEIETIVTTGVFSKIRHPLYLSIIFMNMGIALAFGVMMTSVLALLTTIHYKS
jgi:protein-S-isoprenylcysteine O-methyltransferase Ste14